jgi:hypothetical protein
MDRSEIEYLFKNYYRYTSQRESLLEQIEVLTARATKITASFDPEKVGTAPRDNPRPSKVELYAIKIVKAKEKVKQLDMLIGAGDEMFSALRPHQRYLVRCIVCNGMKPEEFSQKEDPSFLCPCLQ